MRPPKSPSSSIGWLRPRRPGLDAMAHVNRGVVSRLPALAAGACAAALAACAASSPPSTGKLPAQVSPVPMPLPSHDWHALVIVPFGTLLKDVPYRLSEVVVFHDAGSGGAGHEDRDCHTVQGTAPPRFFGRPVGEYSLCFSSDRLNRIEASVSLPAESASAQFPAPPRPTAARTGTAAPRSTPA
jgi:hypothetical protein